MILLDLTVGGDPSIRSFASTQDEREGFMFYENQQKTPFILSSAACFSDSPEQRSVSKGGSPPTLNFKNQA
jgi:hypothetical protein